MWKIIFIVFLIKIIKNVDSTDFVCHKDPKSDTHIPNCFVENLTETSPGAEFSYIGNNGNKLIYLMTFRDCDLYEFPKDLFTFNTIFLMNISNSGLQQIGDKKFKKAENLHALYASNNSISELKSDTFTGASWLFELNLSKNKINKIHKDTFKGLSILRLITLSNNEITSIAPGTFSRNRELYYVGLENNQLVQYNEYSISLKRIHLDDNLLIKLFIGSHIANISASNNEITTIVAPAWSEIWRLILSNNSISEIESLTTLTNLTNLDLSQNNITDLTPLVLLENLEILNLKNVEFVAENFELFFNLTNLIEIDLSSNEIENFDLSDFFYLQKNLKKLFLNENNLTEINYKEIKTILPSIEIIEIYENNWNCTYLKPMLDYFHLKKINTTSDPNNLRLTNSTNLKGINCIEEEIIEEIWKPTSVLEMFDFLSVKLETILTKMDELERKYLTNILENSSSQVTEVYSEI